MQLGYEKVQGPKVLVTSRRRRSVGGAMAAALALVLIASGCGDDKKDDASSSGSGDTTSSTTTPPAITDAEGKELAAQMEKGSSVVGHRRYEYVAASTSAAVTTPELAAAANATMAVDLWSDGTDFVQSIAISFGTEPIIARTASIGGKTTVCQTVPGQQRQCTAADPGEAGDFQSTLTSGLGGIDFSKDGTATVAGFDAECYAGVMPAAASGGQSATDVPVRICVTAEGLLAELVQGAGDAATTYRLVSFSPEVDRSVFTAEG